MEHGTHCLPCSYTNEIINNYVTVTTNNEVILIEYLSEITKITLCQGTKHNCWLFNVCYGNRSVVSSHL